MAASTGNVRRFGDCRVWSVRPTRSGARSESSSSSLPASGSRGSGGVGCALLRSRWLPESRMHNERCMSGSEGGRQKPAVATCHGADARPLPYIPTWAGFLYLAVVLDTFSRRIVGWAMETHLRTELVLQAL